MYEIRKYPECNHVIDVAIRRPTQHYPHDCNWNAAWVSNSNQIICPHAYEIARQLQVQFDLGETAT